MFIIKNEKLGIRLDKILAWKRETSFFAGQTLFEQVRLYLEKGIEIVITPEAFEEISKAMERQES